jgi:hypothetical protein
MREQAPQEYAGHSAFEANAAIDLDHGHALIESRQMFGTLVDINDRRLAAEALKQRQSIVT